MNAMQMEAAPEPVRDAIARLFANDLRNGYTIAGCHRYSDADGSELFRVVRLKHAVQPKIIRPIHRVASRYRLGRPKRPTPGWPIYRPPYPLVESDPVLIVEGEACADELAKRGISAVTSGSADSASAADWTPLRGRSGRMWPDNDEPGAKYGNAVASRLSAQGVPVDLIDVTALDLPDKGDCVDWLREHPNATAADVLALPAIAPPLPAKQAEARNADHAPRVILRRGCDVEPIAVDWIWNGWIAAGKLHLIGGAPSAGKTTIAVAMAATITRGGRWPDGSRAVAGDVVIWSGEDDNADTLNPRLRAAGADMQRVWIIDGMQADGHRFPFDPANDMDALREALREVSSVRLVVVDPIVSAVAADSHKNAETRRGLQPLVDLANEFHCAVLGVTHFSKGTSGRDPVERITGSLAFGALARLVMVAAKQEADRGMPARRVFLRAKSNCGPDGGGFVYDLQQGALDGYPGIEASSVLWGEPIVGTAREVLAIAEASDTGDDDAHDAVAFLRDELGKGPATKAHVEAHAKEAGIAWRTVQRAMRRAGVESKREGFGKSAIWSLTGSYATVAPFAPHSENGVTGVTGATKGQLAQLDEREGDL